MAKSDSPLELLDCIEACCLSKLNSDCDAGLHEAEFRVHGSTLRGRVAILCKLLSDTNVSRYPQETRVQVVSAVLILLHELRSKGPWSPEGFTDHARLIEEAFTGNSNVSLDRFAKDAGEFKEAIFDRYFANLHKKLTAEQWKKYPASVEVYCTFLNQIKEYYTHVELDPVKILPATLLLIHDFNPTFKRKGLQCCLSVLKCLDQDSFKNSNYQQVIFEILNKVTTNKDSEILQLTFKCMEQLIPQFPKLPLDSKWNQFDELFNGVTDDIYLETNVERKSICFEFLSRLITLRTVDCVRCKKNFNLIICDNLDLCTAENIRSVMLQHVLMALKTWLKYCWITWRYNTDRKIMSLLLKLLYIQCNENVSKKNIDDLEAIIICTVSLCTKEQQESILNVLNVGESAIENNMYKERLKHIVNNVYR